MNAETVRETLEAAHAKEMEMIDRKAADAKIAAEEKHQAKLRAFDKAVVKMRDASKTVAKKKSQASVAVSKKAADVTEAVGVKATDLGAKAGEVKTRTEKRMQNQPWLMPMVAVVLLLALALSVGKKMRAPAQGYNY